MLHRDEQQHRGEGMPRRGAIPVVLAVIIAFGAIAGFFATRAAGERSREAELEALADAVATAVKARLQSDARFLAAASEAIAGDPSRPSDQVAAGLTRIGVPEHVLAIAPASSDGPARVSVALPPVAGTSVLGVDLAGQPEWRLLLDLARDAGEAKAAAATRPDGQVFVLHARPLYGTPDVPTDVATRRRLLQGYAVTVSPATTLFAPPPTPVGSELAVRILQGPLVLSSPNGAAASADPAHVVRVNAAGTTWTVETWTTERLSSLPWFVLNGGLLLALTVLGLAAWLERRTVNAAREAVARAQGLALVARMGPLLQQSLELGDLLPVFVVEVSDELDLESVSISLVSATGELVRAFSLGFDVAPPLGGPDSIGTPPASVRPGEVITVPLHRAGRIVGAMRARAAGGLEPPQVETLLAVSNLLAAALGNAKLFQDEQEMVARLRDLDRLKTTFVGSVSHELRTTATAIEGFAQLLADAGPALGDDRRADFIERIRRNAASLTVLVEDLLDFARLERSGIAVALQPVDLSGLVPQIVDQMSSILDGRKVSADVEPAVTAIADPAAIERILVNLLSNAAKYTPPGTDVLVTLRREGADAVMCVSDNGPGIPPDERERIFDLFYRIDNEGARAARGVGIGLALVRQLVQRLNGTIAVDTAPGGGAKFRVTVPLAAHAAPSSPRPPLTPSPSPS